MEANTVATLGSGVLRAEAWTAGGPQVGLTPGFLRGIPSGEQGLSHQQLSPQNAPWGTDLVGPAGVPVSCAPHMQLPPPEALTPEAMVLPAGCGVGGGFLPPRSGWSYRQAQVSTDMLGYTFRTTSRFSSRKRTPREFILSGTQHGSGMPGTMPTALTMLWMVAWLDGRTTCRREEHGYPALCPHPAMGHLRGLDRASGQVLTRKVRVQGGHRGL